MREWIETGEVTMPDEAETEEPPRRGGFEPREITSPVAAARAAEDRPTIKIAEGVKISRHDMDVFKEMGGTMRRTPSRLDPLFVEQPDEVP